MIELGIITTTKGKTTYLNPDMMPMEFCSFEMFEFVKKGRRIVVLPAAQSCPFCGRLGIIEYRGYFICLPCIDDIKKEAVNVKSKSKRRRLKHD